MIARAMRDQVIEPRNALRHIGTVPRRNPPQHQRGLDRSEPFFTADKETPVQGLPDEALQGFDAFPDCQVRQDGRIIVDTHVHRVAALILKPPDETFYLVGQTIHPVDVLDKLAHARVFERITDPRNVELGKMTLVFHHAADSFGAQRAVFQSCTDVACQSKAWSLGPCCLRCSSRATASSTPGRCPAGTHHITKYDPSKCSNHSARRP